MQLDEVDHCTKRRKACISHLVRQRSQKLNQNREEFLRPLCSTLCLEPEGLWRSFWRPAEYFHQFFFFLVFNVNHFLNIFTKSLLHLYQLVKAVKLKSEVSQTPHVDQASKETGSAKEKIYKVKTNKK